MTPRTIAQITSEIYALKVAFDKQHFDDHNLTTAYKMSILINWQMLQVRLAPLCKELRAAESVEVRMYEARQFTHGASDRGYYVAKYASKLTDGKG